MKRWHPMLGLLLLVLSGPGLAGAQGTDGSDGSGWSDWSDWWARNVEIHGFARTLAYGRSPQFEADDFQLVSWRTELDVETDVRIYRNDDWRVSFFGVLRPVYDSNYDINDGHWGSNARGAAPDPNPPGVLPSPPNTAPALVLYDPLTLGASIAPQAVAGKNFPRSGACVKQEFCLGNGDVGSLFSNEKEPALIIDDVLFFGAATAPFRTRDAIGTLGGNATGTRYADYLATGAFGSSNAFSRNSAREISARARLTDALTPVVGPGPAAALATSAVDLGTLGLTNSLALAEAAVGLDTPLNAGTGLGLGRDPNFGQAPFDVNRNETRIKFDCLDNAHPWCFVRDAFFQIDYQDTSVRIGRQQIVWGKTDAFRLQDIVNPIDNGYHNVFPDLEERRIPVLALDAIQSFGDVGPLEDVSAELVWVVDKFLPLQFGQCGEPYAFTLACQGRADAAAHQLFNFGLAQVQDRNWSLANSEPGLRFEFRTPEPSISFSLSAYYGFQDLPVAQFVNRWSAANPNTAAMLFIQGQGLGAVIETLTGTALGSSPWTTGFDPSDPNAASTQAANALAVDAWRRVFDPTVPAPPAPFAGVNCKGLSGAALGQCADPLLGLALPWTAGEYVVKYPRVWTLGGSMDYQIPRADTVLRLEVAYDVDRAINNTSKADARDESGVFLAAIGLDRPTYIPFINETRTALLSFQTFVEHVMDYDAGGSAGNGMVVYENQFITTFLHEHYWRNDSLILRNFVAYDWNADALIMGPSFRWVVNQNLVLSVGLNFLVGDAKRTHNIRNLCSDGSTSCVGNPADWQDGEWQTLNARLARKTQAPWWSRQGFADRFMERRDEFWIGVTYQF